jgi:hypothetical protein
MSRENPARELRLAPNTVSTALLRFAARLEENA